jgi:seryl-tRNA synthetase
MQSIYNKLSKKTPAKRNVKLNKVEDLMDLIKEYRDEMDQIALQSENALTDVQRALGELRILQESKIPLLSVDKDELLNKVLDLGLDVPQELNELDQMLVDAETIDVDAFDLVEQVENIRTELYKFML